MTYTDGLYITFEGPEGCGKSTQLKMLSERLISEGCLRADDIILTKEPGGIPQTLEHRRILLNPASLLTPQEESDIFWDDRDIHHRLLVKPSLKRGKVVLGDRDFDSSWAYQHYARGVSAEFMLARQKAVLGDFKPHLTLLYVGDMDSFLKRVGRRKTIDSVAAGESRFDDEQLSFHERVQNGFLELAKQDPLRFRVLDGMMPIDELHLQTYGVVRSFLDENYVRRN